MIGSEGVEQHCYYYCGEIISEQEIKNNQNKHDNILLLFLTNMIKAKNIIFLAFTWLAWVTGISVAQMAIIRSMSNGIKHSIK